MNPMQVSHDPKWYRFIDGMVILSIGFVIGMITAYCVVIANMETATTKIVPVRLRSNSESGKVLESTDTQPKQFFEIEES